MEPVQQEPILRIEGLRYSYPNGTIALDDISFSLDEGEIVGLVGPSGAGKSTLLMHLNGLLPEGNQQSPRTNEPTAVSVCGLQMARDNLSEIRRLVGFLFQDPDDQLFCPTVREDVAFGPLNLGLPDDIVLERVDESLKSVGLSDFAHRSTLQLSVGERKRVCLAGVFACEPKLLALDEPFSNLDPRARRQLIEILGCFKGSQILATHDLNLIVEHCSRVIVLNQGRIQADGPTRKILADRDLMLKNGLEVPLNLQFAETSKSVNSSENISKDR